MTLQLSAVAFEAIDLARLGRFWAEMLGREAVGDARGVLLVGDDAQLGLRFVPARNARVGPNRVHVHLTSVTPADQQRTVATAIRLGGAHLDVGQRPDEGHVVLGDPEGNEFCVIEPGNAFLDGCGLLGELACDGSRAVGVFWSEALGWPLVWDRDEETAVQSPRGGTKIAWGGPPLAPKVGRNRQELELTTADGHDEVDRLVALGASHLEDLADGGVVLADPDGNEFLLARSAPPYE